MRLKLQKKSKSVADIKRAGYDLKAMRRMDEWRRADRERKMALAASSPEEAHEVGMSYAGPPMDDKGQRDGSCNRTACQMPLSGKLQFYMENPTVEGGRLYYCARCEEQFTRWDKVDRPNAPLRCTPDEDNVNRSTRKVQL